MGTTGCTKTDGYVHSPVPAATRHFYTYSIDRLNWQTSATFNNLTPGDYIFFVKDANGCIGQKMWFENASTCDVSEGYETTGYFYSICGAPVSIYVVPRGVPLLGLFHRQWVNLADRSEFVVNTGQYTIRIKDASGAFYLFHLPVFPSCPITLNTSIRDATCGNNDGSITAKLMRRRALPTPIRSMVSDPEQQFLFRSRRRQLHSPGHGR